MSDRIRSRACIRIREDVEALGAADLEELAWLLVSILEGRDELLLRGHDERGNFIKGITDAFSECGTVAVECGAGAGYFSGGLDKPIADAKHALQVWPKLKRLYLVSTQTVPPSKWQKLVTRLAESVGGNASVGVVSEDVEIQNRKTRVFDATRIAGYLFDSLSKKSALVSVFENYLPSLGGLALEFAYDNSIPANSRQFVGRAELVDVVRLRLETQKACALYGISGMGKTEVAAAVARAKNGPWAEAIWVDAAGFSDSFSFASVPIHRLGRNVNLLGRIKEERTLVIVDDWRGSVRSLVAGFATEAHESSALLVTTQYLDDLTIGVEVPGLPPESAYQLLTLDDLAPPSSQFEKVMAATGGNPLVLWLLRDLLDQGDASWSSIESELDEIGSYAAGTKTVAERIFERHANVLGLAIPALGFLKSSIVEPNLLRAMVGSSTYAAARQRGFFRSVDRDLLRVHDLVRVFAESQVRANPHSTTEVEGKFWNHVAQNLPRPPYHLTRAIHLHRQVIIDSVAPDAEPSLAVRASFNLGESVFDDQAIDHLSSQPFNVHDWAASTSILEAMEVKVRRCHSKDTNKALCQEFASRIEGAALVSDEGSLVHTALLHHAGKFRLWAFERSTAEAHFARVLELDPDYTAARLQLARAIVKKDAPRACAELRTVLDAVRNQSSLGSSSVSVLLAAFQELTVDGFEPLLDEFLVRDESHFANLVQLAATEGFAHPYSVVATLMSRLGYSNPSFALRLLESVGLPEPAADDDRSNLAAGMIQLGRHDALHNLDANWHADEVRVAGESALLYFGRIRKWSNPEEQRNVAKAFHRLGKHADAISLLEQLRSSTVSAFLHYDLAKAYRATSRYEDGLRAITLALDGLDESSERFRATFLRLEAFLLFDKGECRRGIELLGEALQKCTNPTFRAQLTEELQQVEATGEPPGFE